MKKILVYHPTGNQNVRSLLKALSSIGMLHSFHTTIAVFKSAIYYNLLSFKKLERFKRRTYINEIRDYTVQYPFLEMLLFSGKKKYNNKQLTGSLINKLLAYDVAKYIKNRNLDAVFCFPFGALPIFKESKERNIQCFYEQTTGYYKELKKITTEEKSKNPEWASSISIYEESQEVLDTLDQELQMADCIVVASSYIKKTLISNKYPSSKIVIVPYGFPAVYEKQYRRINDDKINILFAGNISQLKGLSYMFEAVGNFPDSLRLTLVGSISNRKCKTLMEYIQNYNYLGSLSHEELLIKMRENDLVIFPSLCDGFGMVVSEAMSQGTPVIASYNSCGPDLIQHGKNGWLIPSANTKAIVNILDFIIKNPDEIRKVGMNALKTAAKRPWSIYEKEIIELTSNWK